MIDVAKFPYLTARKGSSNLYYKREVPPDLRADGRPSQVWRSLRTADPKKAEGAYATRHAEVEALFSQWRKEETRPVTSHASARAASRAAPSVFPLTPALMRRLADAHYLNVYENDFQWRGDQTIRVDRKATTRFKRLPGARRRSTSCASRCKAARRPAPP